MSHSTNPPKAFISCDVGKASIVVFDSRDACTRSVPNRRDRLDALLAGCDETCLVICEATGGYETALLEAALAAGVPAHRADARKVKAFIRSFGILGKTEAIDAKALALYAAERHERLDRWKPRDPIRARLRALVLTRRDLVDQRVAFANRHGAPGAEAAARFISPLIACLKTQIAAIDDEIATLVRQSEELEPAEKTLRSMVGFSTRTAASLLALMPELGTLDRRQAAALAGLAPHPRQSGANDAPRHTRGGRVAIKQLLFLPALSAIRHDPIHAATYKRLVANGKKKMVAIVAVMRKLIVIANAKLRDLVTQTNKNEAFI